MLQDRYKGTHQLKQADFVLNNPSHQTQGKFKYFGIDLK